MNRMPSLARAMLLALDLGNPADHLDLGPVVQIAALGALQPRHLAILFCHDNFSMRQWSVVRCKGHSAQLTTDNGLLTMPKSSSPRPTRPSCRLRGRRS